MTWHGDVEFDGDPSEDVLGAFRDAWADPFRDSTTLGPELIPVRLARACVAVLPVDGAGLSLFDDDFRVPLGASDEAANAAERLQFTHGEGPCLDAARDDRAYVAGIEEMLPRWPMLVRDYLDRTPYQAVASLPFALTGATRGALDLFLCDERAARQLPMADAIVIAREIARVLQVAAAARASVGLSATADTADTDTADTAAMSPDPAWLTGPAARRRSLVWVAMGIAIARLGVTGHDALSLLRASAFAHDLTLDEFADALVARRLDLD